MAKELHNQTLSTSLTLTKRIAFGQPSQDGADNILISDALDDIRGYLKTGTITSSYSAGFAVTDSEVVSISVKLISGTPEIKIGTTAGGTEILDSVVITEDIRFSVIGNPFSGTIYPKIVGSGSAKITIKVDKNLF